MHVDDRPCYCDRCISVTAVKAILFAIACVALIGLIHNLTGGT